MSGYRAPQKKVTTLLTNVLFLMLLRAVISGKQRSAILKGYRS